MEALVFKKLKINPGEPLQYTLESNNQTLVLNSVLGNTITIKCSTHLNCVHCGRTITKGYQGGYCYPCTQRLAQCDMCILKPQQCHFHLGTCSEPEWGIQHCMKPHVVYLSNTSGLKVGISRGTNIPYRWLDQGAQQALVLYEVSTRRVSGLLEVAAMEFVADKTNWRQMLKMDAPEVDILAFAAALKTKLATKVVALQKEFGEEAVQSVEPQLSTFSYPILEYPPKIQSLKLNPTYTGRLLGIKGQYLLFDEGVMNIRNYAGHQLTWQC